MPEARAQALLSVWDLPTRLFHWALAACVAAACASAHASGDAALRLHFASGYAVLALVVFRLLWGFAGARYARFAQFVRGPADTLRYAAAMLSPSAAGGAPSAGHSPLAGVAVLAMLAACGVQAASGLFTDDEIASEGPLAHLASNAVVDRAGALHAWGELALYALVALHLCAIAYYRIGRGEDLLRPMLTGRKAPGAAPPARDDACLRARATLLLAASVALVAYLAYLG